MNSKHLRLALILAFCFLSFNSHAQLVVNNTGVNVNDLVNAISGNGVIVSNATLNCPTGAFGTFTNSTGGTLGMTGGIILTTGDASLAPGPNLMGSSSGGPCTSYTDPDLTAIDPQATNDVCILEFDIIPQCDVLTLDYVFGSEEYPEFVNSSFNDAFGFFISGPNPGGGNYVNQNIALVPGTGTPVSIDNVSPTTNSAYYIDNTGGASIEYDGLTVTLTASVNVDQCATYHMKLAIADAGDCSYDSGVFLDFEGLNCPNNDINIVPIVTDAYEGCGDAHFQITRTDVSGPFTVTTSSGGTATAGTDYTLNGSYSFVNGQGVLDVFIPAADDNIIEGTENAWIYVTWLVCGLPVTDSVEILIHDEIHLAFTNVDPSCGVCDGTSTVNVTGGTAPFSYQWDAAGGNATTQSIGSLCSGTYCVTVTDVNGCVETQCTTLNPSSGLTLSAPTSPETCQGDNDGTITASASGGSGNYTYDIGGPGQPGGSFTGLTPGNYTVTVLDNVSGCSTTLIVTVAVGPVCCSLTPTAVAVDETCNGACDGTATATPTGGVAPFSYVWLDNLNAPIGQTTQTATGLCAGTYSVDVTDAYCTVQTGTVTVNSPPALTGSATEVANTCNAACDGQINASGSGGTGALEYSLDGITFQPGTNFTGLCAGAYTVTIRDANGCLITVNVTVTEPTAITGSATEVANTCNAACDGQINASGSGGTGALEYSLDGITFQPGTNFTGLCAGVYTVTIRDANGCLITVNVTVTEPTAITGSATEVANTCNAACDGQINASGSGGTGALEYSLDGITFQPGTNFTGLCAGAYTVTIRDANGCLITVNVTVTEPTAITGSATEVANTCNAACDGQINASGSGGTGALEYSLDGITFQPGTNFTGLCAGAYTVTIRDANGCLITTNVTVTEPPAVTISVVTVVDATCGQANGSITVSGAGGTGALQFSIDGITFQAGTTFGGLVAGGYTLTVQDANGCNATVPATVLDQSGLVGSIAAQTDALCNGDANGTVDISASGNTATPYQYSIDGGTTWQAATTFTGLAAGPYTVTVEDANGCQITIPVTINEPPVLTVSATEVPNTCFAACDGQINATGGGGFGAYEYSLDGITYQPGSNFTGNCAGSFTVYVRDANGCVATTTVTVTEPTVITASSVEIPNTCFGACDAQIDVTASGGSISLDYSLDAVTYQSSNVFTGVCAGSYTVTVMDGNGCTTTTNVTVTEPPALTVSATEVPTLCDASCDGQINVTSGGGTGAIEYSLDGITFQAGANFSAMCAGTYTVTIRDANGCTATANVTVTSPTALTGAVATLDATCNGTCDGEITASAAGGTSPYQYSIDGITFVPTTVFTGICAGTETITIMDANGCTITVNATINEPAAVSVAVTGSTDASCGLANGDLTVAGAGGTTPYQYSIDGITFQAGTTFGSLAGGSYTITIEDANGCTSTVGGTVVDQSGLAASINTQTDALCFGSADGTVDITAGGNVATPYQYSIDGGATWQAASSFNGLAAGSYTVTVEDTNGCQVTVAVVIGEATQLTASAVETPTTCNGGCDGIITVTTTGGTTPYVCSIDGGVTFQASNVFSGLCAGAYTILVQDANGCTTTVNISVTEPTAVSFTSTSVNSTCGTADGSITVTGSGGAGGYQYSIDGGTLQASGTFTGLFAGTYTLLAEDANGCQFTNTVNISNNAAPVIDNTSFVDPTCNMSCDGSITVTASGGTGALQFSINGGALQAGGTFNALCGGTHDIMVEDANGCQAFAQVVLTDPPAVAFTAAITDLICFQDNGGAIDVSASGGDNSYTYSIDGITFQASNVFGGLAAGNYTVTVMDGAGCTATGVETVTEPAELTMTFSAFDASCFGMCDGAAIVIPAGGTVSGLYTFSWTIPGVGNTANPNTICAGTYTLTVTDDNGCFIDTTFTINEPTPFVITTSATPSTCNQADGTATVDNVTGGAGGFTYLWDSNAASQPTATATGLIPGPYDVTITDMNGCDSTITVTVPNTPGVVGSLLSSTDVTCNGLCDGTAEVDQSGGTSPYSYLWSNGTTTALATGLCAGTYDCTITDATGCTDVVTVVIGEPTPAMVNVSADTTICLGGTATLVANGSGGTPGYTYDWNAGAFTGATITDMPIVNTSYTVIATDANGCASAPQTVNVTILPPLSLVMSADVSICPGNSATISGAASGGDGGPYTYNWTNDAGLGWTATGSSQTVFPNTTTMYYLTVSDGCETPAIVDSVEVFVNPTPTVTFTSDVVDGCEPLTVTFTNTTDPLLVGSNCLWDFGDGNTSSNCNTATHTYELPGTYDVTLTFDSPSGCTGTGTVVGMITVHPNPIASFDFNPDPADMQNPNVCFNNTSTNGFTYNWYFSDLDSSSMENPCYEFPAPGDYPVMMMVTTQFGCTDFIIDTVTIEDVFSIYVPNAFTPDDDGVNDFFWPEMQGHDPSSYQFMIFNRWGERIFDSKNDGVKWDGTYKGMPVKQDVYVWKVIVKDGQENESHEYVGHVTLLR